MDKFIYECKLINGIFIEQPILAGVEYDTKKIPIPVWADEELKNHNPISLIKSGYGGFMLKILHHDSHKLKMWIEASRRYDIPFYISGVICDTLHYKHMQYFDTKTKYQNCLAQTPGFIQDELYIEKNPYQNRDFSQCIDDINKKYEYICSLTF